MAYVPTPASPHNAGPTPLPPVMALQIVRTAYTVRTTRGQLYVEGRYFCETLEDAARQYGVKIPGETCIPLGLYYVTITPSARFGRQMVQLYTHKEDLSCRHGGVIFTGVRLHGGNTHGDTAGCPLVAFKSDGPDRIKNSAEGAVFAVVERAMRDGRPVTLEIVHR